MFVGKTADKANWVEVGRSYQRFALQASALGIRNAMLNQPVEVVNLRPELAGLLGIGAERPDLVVRFGRGPKLPVTWIRRWAIRCIQVDATLCDERHTECGHPSGCNNPAQHA